MKKLLFILFAAAMTLTSCTSPRYTAVNNLRNLSDDLAHNYSYYDAQDWAKAKAKYERINDKIGQYRYTPEERAEIGELQGTCMGYFAKGAVEGVVDRVTGVINQATGIVKGVKDAFGKKY